MAKYKPNARIAVHIVFLFGYYLNKYYKIQPLTKFHDSRSMGSAQYILTSLASAKIGDIHGPIFWLP